MSQEAGDHPAGRAVVVVGTAQHTLAQLGILRSTLSIAGTIASSSPR